MNTGPTCGDILVICLACSGALSLGAGIASSLLELGKQKVLNKCLLNEAQKRGEE